MIDRDYRGGPIIVRCDGCAPEYIETGEKEFAAGVGMARRNGWEAKHQGPGHGWCHYCPDCVDNRVWDRRAPIRTGRQ